MTLDNIRSIDLAKCIGKSHGFAWQIKNKLRPLPIKYCEDVSKTFGIPLYELRPDVYRPSMFKN